MQKNVFFEFAPKPLTSAKLKNTFLLIFASIFLLSISFLSFFPQKLLKKQT